MEDLMKDRVDQLVNYIMKNCLWQFHSRAWDRKRQNEGILTQTAQLLCGETVRLETPLEKCYWVDAVCLAEAFKENYPWIKGLGAEDVRQVMHDLHERMDYLTVTGSLNLELNDQHY
jgi:Fe-only nitrogenase delta subunit